MPFGMVSGVGKGMGVDGRDDRRRERGSFGGEFGASHCNQRGLCCVVVRKRRLFPIYFGEGLVIFGDDFQCAILHIF